MCLYIPWLLNNSKQTITTCWTTPYHHEIINTWTEVPYPLSPWFWPLWSPNLISDWCLNFAFWGYFGLIQWGVLEGFISAHSGPFPPCFTLLCLPYILCIYSTQTGQITIHFLFFVLPLSLMIYVLFSHFSFSFFYTSSPCSSLSCLLHRTGSQSHYLVRFSNCKFSLLTCPEYQSDYRLAVKCKHSKQLPLN